MDRIEFLKEEQNLEETLEVLNAEILNYIDKRKGIVDYILDYRKKFVEEYKDDEDKLIEYFDHERYVKEEAYRTIDRKLSEFTKLKESPYFGKIIFTDEGVAETAYIGRYGLTPEGSYEPKIVDWRAPVASLFYKGMLGKTSYKSPVGEISVDILGRRQLMVKKAKLEGYFDSDVNVQDEILQMVLSSNSGEKLRDIVMTIQKEQDEIIRAERNKIVVVNGVAGSGKTTIALHRIAYLLYNYREQLTDKVLILGPNDIFMDYISEVLPTLGETAVRNETFLSFAYKEIGLEEPVVGLTAYLEEVLKNNEEAIEEIKYKSSKEFIEFLDFNIGIFENQYFKPEAVKFFGEEIVGLEEIEELFNKHYKYMPLFRRGQKIKRILISKIKDKRDEKVREINKDAKEKLASLTPEQLLIEENNIEFQRRIAIREVVREVMNARLRLDAWIENDSIVDIYKELVNKNVLSYLDLPAILYLMVKLDGKKVRNEIKHIVVDEAQDYNYLQFLVLKELTGCKSYTIVGDANQRLIKAEEVPAMLRLKDLFGGFVNLFELNKSYRSTFQIMDYANKILDENAIVPFVRKGEFDVLETSVPAEDKEGLIDVLLNLLEDYQEENFDNVAVITKDKEELNKIAKDLKSKINILAFDSEDVVYRGGKVIVPSYFAKGLEFDGVIVVDFDENTNDLIKYIMCTRALHRLSVVKVKNK
ncbi:HelD family protein [Clostridium septicum]|uniref:AAA family ATPase n=1 Tax=Clostridium septicum TaxID=1504 RepID=A0A9N7JK33_CLOSE|nr:UvrD-helicase domain-containing protein [Clostridium septicum]AYE34063.1 ATP-dependent DNA helicase [Clostridium septicum]QAS59434.1 DEAD/DEAH box helicase [Clostridium septicum]UEC21312.1 AAA family ATPase [Clostridium septicum]USS00643.1 AAA family ATPase [Clostridium septicum]